MELSNIFGQIPSGRKARAPVDNLADSLIALAEVFGHDAILGAEYEGKGTIDGKEVRFEIRRKPMGLVKAGHLIEFLNKKQEEQERQSERARLRRR